jgi:hypothetical protein
MADWTAYAVIYGLIGFLMGEIYLIGIRKKGDKPSGLTYIIGVSVWPVALALGVLIAFKIIKKES